MKKPILIFLTMVAMVLCSITASGAIINSGLIQDLDPDQGVTTVGTTITDNVTNQGHGGIAFDPNSLNSVVLNTIVAGNSPDNCGVLQSFTSGNSLDDDGSCPRLVFSWRKGPPQCGLDTDGGEGVVRHQATCHPLRNPSPCECRTPRL